MKTKHYNLLFLIILLFSFVQVSAQVTIGHGTAPEQGALLELKEKEVVNPDKNNISGLENSTKGILYPKVSLKASNLLTPLYGGADQGNGNWSDEATAEQKVLATGMVVYNVNPDAKNMEEGLYMWRLEEWIKLSGGIGAAQFNLTINADRGQMEHVLINLIKNAWEAIGDRREPCIKISVMKDSIGTTIISVSDNGCGIDIEKIDKIFMPFYTTKPNGSGIGLSICRQMINLHGGTITVSSQPELGSSFIIRLG